jgi:hypothetical protein
MKDNRKNRKLIFIRTKNGLRLGLIKFYCSEKVSNIIHWNNDLYWNRLTDIAKKSLYKNYKLKTLNKVEVSSGYLEDDFVKDLTTNVVKLSLK